MSDNGAGGSGCVDKENVVVLIDVKTSEDAAYNARQLMKAADGLEELADPR